MFGKKERKISVHKYKLRNINYLLGNLKWD